jgi:aminopeptidase N
VANNLTREEARDRRQLLDVGSYQVELDLTGNDDTFRSVSIVRFQAPPGAASFVS